MDIIGTGLSGLVGSRVISQLSSEFSFTDLSKETGFDLMDFSRIRTTVTGSSAPWVFHFAAYTDVQGAQKEKDQKKQSISWQVNVSATENIVNICKDTGKRLLYISTDYVFDGTKDEYDENDTPNPLSWYGRTKYEGELRVKTLGDQALIIRIANPYRSNPIGKMDFVHKILERFISGLDVEAPKDQLFCPTFIDDLSFSVKKLLEANASGYFHVVSYSPLNPYEAARMIASVFHITNAHIVPTLYEQYFVNKALPPKHAHLKHGKIDTLGVPLHSFREGLLEVLHQEKKG